MVSGDKDENSSRNTQKSGTFWVPPCSNFIISRMVLKTCPNFISESLFAVCGKTFFAMPCTNVKLCPEQLVPHACEKYALLMFLSRNQGTSYY